MRLPGNRLPAPGQQTGTGKNVGHRPDKDEGIDLPHLQHTRHWQDGSGIGRRNAGTIDAEAISRGGPRHAGDRARCADENAGKPGVEDHHGQRARRRGNGPEEQEAQGADADGQGRTEHGEPDRIDDEMGRATVQQGMRDQFERRQGIAPPARRNEPQQRSENDILLIAEQVGPRQVDRHQDQDRRRDDRCQIDGWLTVCLRISGGIDMTVHGHRHVGDTPEKTKPFKVSLERPVSPQLSRNWPSVLRSSKEPTE